MDKHAIRDSKYELPDRICFLIRISTTSCSNLQESFLSLYIYIVNIKPKEKEEMTQLSTNISTEKFQNAEQLWFWFMYSKQMRENNFGRIRTSPTRRPCEVLDVETMITKLYLSGRLDNEQLCVMKKYGDKRRAPHQYIWNENRDAQLWCNAMKTIEAAARSRDWIY